MLYIVADTWAVRDCVCSTQFNTMHTKQYVTVDDHETKSQGELSRQNKYVGDIIKSSSGTPSAAVFSSLA